MDDARADHAVVKPKSFEISFCPARPMFARGLLPFRVRSPASGQPVAFFGRYIDVTPPSRLVWTMTKSTGPRDHSDLRGKRRQDPGRRARPLSLEGSAGRSRRLESTGAWPEQFEGWTSFSPLWARDRDAALPACRDLCWRCWGARILTMMTKSAQTARHVCVDPSRRAIAADADAPAFRSHGALWTRWSAVLFGADVLKN